MRKGFLVTGTIVTVAGILILLPVVQLVELYMRAAQLSIVLFLLRIGGGIVVALGVQAIIRSKSPRTEPPGQVKEMLGPNEKSQFYVRQTRFWPFASRYSWVLTNERVIERHRRYFLMKEYTDFSYADITSLAIDQRILHSTLEGKIELDSKDEEVNYDVPLKDKITKRQIDDQVKTYKPQIKKLEEKLEPPLRLSHLSKSDARKADGIIRENMVRFRTPFFQTPFPSDKVAYGSTQKNT